MCAPQAEQHGRRHRKTNQEVLDEYISLRQEVKNAYMYVEVCKVMEDILYAMVTSGIRRRRVRLRDVHVREQARHARAQAVGARKFGDDRPLAAAQGLPPLQNCVNWGLWTHASMPWQVEERKKRAV